MSLCCVFVIYRVMQGVAWLLSVLVIGINMFFVIEYVVSPWAPLPAVVLEMTLCFSSEKSVLGEEK